jgi:hypothetical protein
LFPALNTFKPDADSLEILKGFARTLRDARTAKSKAEKAEEASKDALAKWLKENRDYEVSAMRLGDVVFIEDVVMIEVNPRRKFDEQELLAADPDTHEQWMRTKGCTYFRPRLKE